MGVQDVVWRASPNCGPRRGGLLPSLIVIHYTAMQSAREAVARLCDPAAEVSAHYLISGTGAVTAMVDETQRAWHAGQGTWAGQDDINSRSIGIELDNRGTHPFSEPQMARLEALLRGIMERWHIPASGVIGHSDMAPGRKADPGRRFDWARLARQGLAVPGGNETAAATSDAVAFRRAAQAVGYSADVDDATLLTAVRLRFRPQATGPFCPADIAALPDSH